MLYCSAMTPMPKIPRPPSPRRPTPGRPAASLLFALTLLLWPPTGCNKDKANKADETKPTAAARAVEKPAPMPGPPLLVSDVSFAGAAGHRPDATFAAGETVSCLFSVSNFTYHKRKGHIEADVLVRGPGDIVVLRQPKLTLLEGEAPTARPGTIRSAANLPIPVAAPAGSYTVQLTLRDLLGRREGKGSGSFTLVGTPPKQRESLALAHVALAGDEQLPPGAVAPITFTVQGIDTRAKAGDQHQVDLAVAVELQDGSGKTVHRRPEETLVRAEYSFPPVEHPVEYQLPLPRDLAPGVYRARLTVEDRAGKRSATGQVVLKVVEPAFGIYNGHVHDAGGLSRSSFLLGEQVFVRFSVYGLRSRDGEVSAAVDLAVAGPDNGVYLARKDAAVAEGEASRAVARAGRFPVQLPLTLPLLAHRGVYRLVLRARDRLAGKETTRELKIHLRGNPPKPMTRFGIDDLVVRGRADLPPTSGDTFAAGRTYHLTAMVGGVKLEPVAKMIYRARLQGGLKLRNLKGEVVHEQNELFALERKLSYVPLRLLVSAKWQVPADLPGGLYDLQVTLLNPFNDQVSQMTRRVEIIPQAPAVEVKLP